MMMTGTKENIFVGKGGGGAFLKSWGGRVPGRGVLGRPHVKVLFFPQCVTQGMEEFITIQRHRGNLHRFRQFAQASG